MHAVDTEVARPHPANDGVEIRAIAIEEPTCIVYRLRLFQNFILEQTAGIRIRQHEGGNVIVKCCFERAQIDTAARRQRDRLYLVPADRRRRRVRAMGGIRH